MQFSQLTNRINRINGEGAAAWDLHEVAVKAAAGEDVIVLSVGDPDFATPQAAIDALEAGDTHYQLVTGRPELRQLIADQLTPQT